MTRLLESLAVLTCVVMALSADSMADKPHLVLAGVGVALVLIWIAERRCAKKKRRPGTRNTKAANRTDCNHTIYHYRYYRR